MRIFPIATAALASILIAPFSTVPAADDPALVAPTEALSAEEERKRFHLPPGFEIQLVAAEPEIHKPLNIAFDARGRLWVTDTVEYPFPAKDPEAARDAVKILEDLDGDGRADRIVTFAEKLNIPIGLIPTPDGAIVHSIPKVYRFYDDDGDGRADRRIDLYGGFENRDTHGMVNSFTWGFDGWIYACHGFANTSEVRGADGHTVRMNSGNTFRFRADGSRVEQFTHGQVNPFGLSFDPLGNLYSADCHSLPAYQLLRGAYYPSFGKPDDGMGFGPVIIDHDHGSTGISGIVYYAADHFPEDYRGDLFIANPVTGRINRDRLERRGSTNWTLHRPDFVRCDDPWFRPVYLQLGPDGALYIADFYNCIIGHYEVPLTHPRRDRERGRIWRVVYKGEDAGSPPARPRADWTRASAAELIEDLGHSNLAARTLAANELVFRIGAAAAEPLRLALREGGAFQRVHALWALERLGALGGDLLAAAARDGDAGVRTHARHLLAERGEWSAADRELALAGLDDADATVQRAAAQALGRHPRPDQLPALLALRRRVPPEDTHLLHAVRLAIRDQLRLPGSWAWLAGAGTPDEDLVLDVVLGVHAPEAAAFLLGVLARRGGDVGRLDDLVRHAARHLEREWLGALLGRLRELGGGEAVRQAQLLRAYHRGLEARGEPIGAEALAWAEELAERLVVSPEREKLNRGLELVRELRLAGPAEQLRGLAQLKAAPEDVRRGACDTLFAVDPAGQVQLLGKILADGDEPQGIREHAAALLGRFPGAESREAMASALRAAPERLARRIAESLAASREGGERLLEEIGSGKTSPRLLEDRAVRAALERAQIPELRERLGKLTEGLPEVDDQVRELIRARRESYVSFARAGADPAAGAAVFEKNCAPCHRIAGKGAKVGPDLDGIGLRGIERLIEDLLDPSRNVDQAFRASIVVLRSGVILTGLIQGDEGEVIALVNAAGETASIPRRDVRRREISALSPMPGNFHEVLSEEDFNRLLAYLSAQRFAMDSGGAAGRLRVIVETDAGGDPDDEQSLVRFLLYACEWDVEGIIANRPEARPGENRNPERTGLGIVRRMIDAYGACYSRLIQHDPRYPPPERLRERTVAGYGGGDGGGDGVRLVLEAADRDDPRPVWFLNWGTDNGSAPSSLKLALDRVLAERGPEGYARFKSRLRLASDDQFGDHTAKIEPPFALWVDTFRPPREGKRWYHRFSAITAKAGGFDIERDARTGHGPLGALYPLNTTHPQKEGDSGTFLYLVPTGMNDPEEPGWGSWAGRYGPRPDHPGRPYFWAGEEDDWNGSRSRDNVLRRWAEHLQNDFRARLDWCVEDRAGANHPPEPRLDGEPRRRAAPGETVILDAGATTDPDGDPLRFYWIHYPECGTYDGPLPEIRGADSPRAEIAAPDAKEPATLHLILIVTDAGSPPLTRYRRVILAVSPAAGG